MIDQQLMALTHEADDARVRALVGESREAEREHREAQRHVDAMTKSRASTVAAIGQLERTVDELLERFAPDPR